MVYSAEISRDHPTCLLFVIDQSGSMEEKMATGRSKSEFVSDALNKTIYNIITNCTKADGVRNYFEIGVIGYGAQGVVAGLSGGLSSFQLFPISRLAEMPLRVEDRTKLDDDGAGGVFERKVKFPVWFTPTASGGTPMCAALTKAAELLVQWCDSHPNCYPPTILHVTDGESSDGNPEAIATAIKSISTNDGECLLFNLHISTLSGQGIQFPSTDISLPDLYAKQLFEMSTLLPEHIAKMAKDKGYQISESSKGFMFNADPKDLVNFFEIGTRPRLTVDR